MEVDVVHCRSWSLTVISVNAGVDSDSITHYIFYNIITRFLHYHIQSVIKKVNTMLLMKHKRFCKIKVEQYI